MQNARTGPNNFNGFVQVSALVTQRTVEFGSDLEQGRHCQIGDFHLRTRMASGSFGRSHDAGSRARQNRFCQAFA